MLEIEAKARINDPDEIEKKIKQLGFRYNRTEKQKDIYYRHPKRDFSKTDEAFRIRKNGREYCLTYKGPKLDKITKTRKEVEIKIFNAENAMEILACLGFKEAGIVEKKRKVYRRGEYSICIDNVTDLGDFLEIEKNAETYDIEGLLTLLDEIGIQRHDLERRSYLELLLES